jgi:hypothetical protein
VPLGAMVPQLMDVSPYWAPVPTKTSTPRLIEASCAPLPAT